MIGEPKSLPSRYYAAEATVAILSAVVILLRLFGIAPDQPIPILNIKLSDPQSLPAVVVLLVIAVATYCYVEWRVATFGQPHVFPRVYFVIAGAVVTAWLSYPLITKGTRLQSVSTGWYFGAVFLGIVIGFSITAILYVIPMIRSLEVSQKLALPRVPYFAKATFTSFGLAIAAAIVFSVVLYLMAPQQIRMITLCLIGGGTLLPLTNDGITFLLKRVKSGSNALGEDRYAAFRDLCAAADYWSILSHAGSTARDELGVAENPTQRDVRDAIRAPYDEPLNFHAISLEPINIRPINVAALTDSPKPRDVTVHIEAEKSSIRVRAVPDDPSLPAREMDLPVAMIEEHANHYLANYAGELPVEFRSVISYAINQSVLAVLSSRVPLDQLVFAGEEARLKARIDDGADVNEPGAHGWTALLAATAQGYVPIVKMLLESGADPDVANAAGRTPLHFAARYGNAAICGILLDYHANLDKQCPLGETPLMAAINYGHEHIAKLLLRHGADPELRDWQGHSALDIAKERHLGEIAALLRAAARKKAE